MTWSNETNPYRVWVTNGAIGTTNTSALTTYGTIITEAGSKAELEFTPAPADPSKPTAERGVSARLYFKFVKSKLTKLEADDLRLRMAKLQRIVKQTQEVQQFGLYEKSVEAVALCIRQLEAIAIGCDRYVTRSVIDKYTKVRKEDGQIPVYFSLWHKFPRTAPEPVIAKIKAVQAKKVFDEYHVLYLDYTKDKVKELPSTKDKIKEKDPILFGTFAHDPDKFYFIVDWVDDYCDLTFDKFIDAVGKFDAKVETVPELTPEYFESVKKEVMERQQRLQETNSKNYKEKMAEQARLDEERTAPAADKAPAPKTPWWKKKLW